MPLTEILVPEAIVNKNDPSIPPGGIKYFVTSEAAAPVARIKLSAHPLNMVSELIAAAVLAIN